MSEEVAAIIVAAGQGRRMTDGVGVKKQFRMLKGRPVFHWSVAAFDAAPSVDRIVVVTAEEDVDDVAASIKASGMVSKPWQVVPGGRTRQESVAKGLKTWKREEVKWVIVHDGVRPLVKPRLIEEVLAAAKSSGAATAGLPVKETIKVATPDGRVTHTLDRSTLWSIQTPQAFLSDLLIRAHQEAPSNEFTDDCSLVESLGHDVQIVMGDDRNLKLTTPSDWATVERYLEDETEETEETEGKQTQSKDLGSGGARGMKTVTGFGFDVHRLSPGRALILGGVTIDHDVGLFGHSDADVLAHAITDALLGAASMGDIGTHFPDTDPMYSGADSLKLLAEARKMVVEAGCVAIHVDAFISAERPRLAPYIDDMRQKIAKALSIDPRWVSVKAGTGEGAGPVGRGEVIEARAVVTLERPG